MRLALAALVLLILPMAAAQNATAPSLPAGVEVVQGGEPGVRVSINGVDLLEAATAGGALQVDPSQPANLSLALTPPPNTTWDIRAFTVGLVVNGPGSAPPSALTKASATQTTIPPGFTVFVNRTVDLSSLKPLGAGLFLMQVTVKDAQGGDLYAQTFYVHVKGNVFLTASGITVTVASAATGYGLWQILRDVKEFLKARERHRRKEGKEGLAGKAMSLAGAGLDVSGGAEGVVSALGDADSKANRLEKRRPVAWTATGFGLGGVGVSWAQFLGYVPLNLGDTLVWALGLAAMFLTLSLLTVATYKRLQARSLVPSRTLVPEGLEGSAAKPRARR